MMNVCSQLEVLKQTLCELGFTVNVEKSQLVPVNDILYLGFIINSIAMRLQLPVVKLEKIVSACKALLAKTRTLSGSLDYDKTLSLSSQARSDLQWVIENITQW